MGKNSRRSRRISRGGALHRKGERNSRVVSPFTESPRCLIPFQGNLFSLHWLDFQAEDRLTPRWHVEQPCRKASLESLVGKPRVKATDPLIQAKGRATLLLQLGGKRTCMPPLETRTDSPGETPEVPQNPCQLWRGILRFGTESTQDLRPRHRLERNPERPPSNSNGDWPFLRPPERVAEVPVLSREHLPQLEKIQEVLPSRRDEAHFR